MSDPAAATDAGTARRSLILAGGGYKVAFQAGVLQVWLDEAGIRFDHFDGASGGNLNLAMICQGMNGTDIAQNWRRVSPVRGIGFNWREWPKLIYADSLLTYDNFRRNVLPAWGIDWTKIRASKVDGTFNLYDFSDNKLLSLPPTEMDEDLLIASISLPMWFPQVDKGGKTYIDAVFLTDGNVEEAIRRGAEEIWIIWTVSERGEWGDGFVADYFGIIETVANGNLRRQLDRIEASNAAIADGRPGEFERTITVRELRAEVPLHYLVILGGDRVAESVNQGVRMARTWCQEQGFPLRPPAPLPADRTRFHFGETMAGHFAFGATTAEESQRHGRDEGTQIRLELDIDIRGFDRFMTNPEHVGAISGSVVAPALGGRRPIERGTFNLFVDDGDAADSRFRYQIDFTDAAGHPLSLLGEKMVHDDPGFDIWADTTTLRFTILARPDGDDDEPAPSGPLATGIVRISALGLLKELTTFNVQGGSVTQRMALLGRFGRLFFGKIWDVYLRRLLPYSPL